MLQRKGRDYCVYLSILLHATVYTILVQYVLLASSLPVQFVKKSGVVARVVQYRFSFSLAWDSETSLGTYIVQLQRNAVRRSSLACPRIKSYLQYDTEGKQKLIGN